MKFVITLFFLHMKYLLSFPCVCVCVASLYFKEMAVRRNDKRTMRTFWGLKGSINTGKTIIQLDHGLMFISMES